MKPFQKYQPHLRLIIITMLLLSGLRARAQLTAFNSLYWQDQYLANPAMAGMEKGLDLNLGYMHQWTGIPGSPKLQNLTAEYNAGKRVGLGFVINTDQAGLIDRTRAMATYAYHLPISAGGDKLNFGLSLGVSDTYIDYNRIVGDAGDAEAESFNQKSVYLDGDFGMSYTSGRITLQGAVPNLKSIFFKKEGEDLEVDRSTFYSAISYKLPFDNQYSNFSLEPKVAYRGVKGFDNILDVGANLDMTSYNFNVSGMYHTNQTVTLGFGLDLQTTELLFAYTNNTGPLSNYANSFEFGIKFRLLR